ncbi:hypothetical protein Zmor_017234 [Zophobas morio]|uniref:Gustatory receptor n=1 Tax=Zophobas morio TaxID=2755281 RepID=A0AA38I4U9_9CUCU|nr:hypothetical protein Zmor_017234 [Zophobas morio]
MFTLSIKDINFIHPLFNYLRIFFITPWYDFHENHTCRLQISKICGVALIVLKIYCIVYSANDDIVVNSIPKQSITQKFISLGVLCTLICLDVVTVIKSWDIENWKTLFTNLQTVDQKLQNVDDLEKSVWKNFYLSFSTKQVIFLLLVVYQMYILSSTTQLSPIKILFLTGSVQHFVEYLVSILLNCLVQVFKSRYKDLNARLVEIEKAHISREMKNLVQSYRILSENVHIFNSLFGYQIILIMFHFGIEVVNGLNSIFISFVISDVQSYYGYILLGSACVFIVMMHNLLIIIIPIHSTTQEGKRFVDLCAKLQEEVSEGSCEAKSLSKWATISQQYVPDFSAAGFFSINKTLIFTVVGNVATYFIITIQLNESEYSKMSKV